ncbi:hypothetical protein F5Y10DRAFT_268220 [Nemania abortiva]|nr:hypothetical protein F5Y10DRAFT_268220 [Nemania abortiva]
MAPIVKVWLVTLNEGHSVVETAFSGIWNEVIMTAASYSGDDGHYGLFHSDEEPGLLAVILGYPSPEMSEHVQQHLRTIIPRLASWITHQELYQMDMSISELSMSPEKIAILFSESQPSESNSLPGKGKWAESAPSIFTSHLPVDPNKPKKMTWVHVAPAADADRLRELGTGTVRKFTMIMESRIASQAAE